MSYDDENDALMLPVDADEDLIHQEEMRYQNLRLYKASKRAKSETSKKPDAKLTRARKKASTRKKHQQEHPNGWKRRDAEGYEVKYTGLQRLPDSEKDINKLADEMVVWVNEHPEVYKLEEFPLSKMYSPWKFFRLASKYPYFDEALSYANNLIGTRLQNMLVHQGVSQHYVMKMLPLYNTQYRAWKLEERATREAQKAQNIVTVIPEWAVSPEVLEKARRRDDEPGDQSNS